MKNRIRAVLEVVIYIALVALIWMAIPLPTQAHTVDCAGRGGIDLARCERHQTMAAKCGPIKGEAHFACDREFLLKHPLDCKAMSEPDAAQCEVELAAVRGCEPKAGREFLVCVRDAARSSPLGRP